MIFDKFEGLFKIIKDSEIPKEQDNGAFSFISSWLRSGQEKIQEAAINHALEQIP